MKKPIYLDIYERFVADIKSGAILPDQKLPSKRQLAELLQVSRTTVETAFDALLSEGYIYSKPKIGYFACRFEALTPTLPAEKTLSPEKTGKAPEISLSADDVDTSLFPYSTWAKLSKEVVYNSPQLLKRGDGSGDIELRRELCSFLCEMRGVRCLPEQIIIGAGIDYILQLLVRILPGDTVFGLENPGYRTTCGLFSDRRVIPIPVDGQGLSVDALAKTSASVVYATPSHQFPLGVTMPVSRRSRLLLWASEKEGRYVIEDDYDSEYRYAAKTIPAMQGLDEHGKVIYVGTFSRTLAPSFRIAFAVLPPKLLYEYRDRCRGISSTVSRFEQQTLRLFMEKGCYLSHLRRSCNAYKAKQKLFRELLSENEGIRISGAEAGLHFLISVEGKTEDKLIDAALAEGVGVRGLSDYWHGGGCPEGTLVVGFAGLDAATLSDAASRLCRAFSRL